MKLLYTLLLLLTGILISSHSVAQGSLAALDAKNGFKGFVFGSSIDNYKSLTCDVATISKYDEEFDSKYDWYVDDLKPCKTNDRTLSIGDLKINTLVYHFFNKRLMRVDFSMKGPVGKELLQLYKSLYGNPKVINGKSGFGSNIITYSWRGKKVSLNVTYCANPYQGSTVISGSNTTVPSWCRVVYLSLPMLSEMKGVGAKKNNQMNKSRANDL